MADITHEEQATGNQSNTKRVIILALLLGAMLGGGLLLWLGPSRLLHEFRALIDFSLDIVEEIPAWQFALFVAVGCSFPIPSSPFFIAAGLAYPPLTALTAIGVGLLGNLILSYFLASWGLRKPITLLLSRRNLSPPNVSGLKPWELVLLLRLMPGVPLVFQSYLLGLFSAPLLPYLLISWPLAMLAAAGLALAGRGFYNGSLGVVLLAVSILVCLSIGIKLATRYWANRKQLER